MSKIISVLEIDAPLDRDLFINHKPGQWVANLTPGPEEPTDDVGNTYFYGNKNNTRKRINSLKVDGVVYAQGDFLDDLDSQDEIFFWDQAQQFLYIRFTDDDPPGIFESIRVGSSFGWSDKEDAITANVYDSVSYPVRIVRGGLPKFNKKRDALTFGILSFSGGNVTLDNSDGEFDDFANQDLFGQPARIYFIEEGETLMRENLIVSGNVGKNLISNWNTFTISVQDPRSRLTGQVGKNTFTPFNENQSGQVKPVAWGAVRRGFAYRTAANSFVFADTEFNAVSVTGFAVYEDNVDVTGSVTGTITDGTFDYTATDSNAEITVDFQVEGFATGLDVLENILKNYNDIDFNSVNYNVSEWNKAKESAFETTVYINDPTEVRDIINQITSENQGIFDYQNDNRISFRIWSRDANPVAEIENQNKNAGQSDVLQGNFIVDYPINEFLSSVIIKYSKNQAAGRFKSKRNTDFENEVKDRYNQERALTIETGLNTETDADSLGDRVMEQNAQIVPTVSISLWLPDYKDLRIFDFVVFNLVRPNGTGPGVGTFEILQIAKNISRLELSVSMRQIPGASTVVPDDDAAAAAVYEDGSAIYGEIVYGGVV